MNDVEQYPYSPSFQNRILAALLQDPGLYPRYYSVWNSSYFTDPINQIIATVLFEFRSLHKQSPNIDTVINSVITRNERSPDDFKKQLVERINILYTTELVDQQWTEKVVVDWARAQAIEAAVIESADCLSKNQKSKIPKIIDQAYRTGENIEKLGLFVDKNSTKPSVAIKSQKINKLPTGFSDLDPLIEGGVGGGELLVFLGPPKGFKSGNLLNSIIPSLQAPYGKAVTYISLELKEEKVYERFCYRITKLDKDFLNSNPEAFDKKFEERIQQILSGKLAIKVYPTRSAGCSQVRSYLDFLDSRGHQTGLLVVDYGNIMKVEDARQSEWTGIGANFEGLRAIGLERDIPVITAARTNREGLLSEDLKMEHIAGSMEISATCDYCVALIQTPEEHRSSTMRQKLLLNRNEDSGIIIGCDIDYPTYTIVNTGIINSSEEEEDEENPKEKRREESNSKRIDLKNSKSLPPDQLAKLKSVLSHRT
jgi:replicative DNA helicase